MGRGSREAHQLGGQRSGANLPRVDRFEFLPICAVLGSDAPSVRAPWSGQQPTITSKKTTERRGYGVREVRSRRVEIESIEQVVARNWDVIVIGTGMGGATFGHALARAGRSVLFCERGASSLGGNGLRGDYAETLLARSDAAPGTSRAGLLGAGRCADELVDFSGARPKRFVPYVGIGTGGSSSLYGMALERLFPSDFSPRQHHRAAADSTLPDTWPISYEELAPYYAMAERLYRVRGNGDPLRADRSFGYVGAPPEYSPAAQELAGLLERNGMHPYHLPLACEYSPGCAGCQGYLCANQCKNDSAQICLAPALTQHGAALLDGFEVSSLESSTDRVTGVIGRREGREYRLKAKVIALAAGALATPLLLLRSRSPEWPQGLANESGLVGRNLMRHFVDLYAVYPKQRPAEGTNLKEIGLNDLYAGPTAKLGAVQSFGAMPPGQVLVDGIHQQLRGGKLRPVAHAFGLVKPFLRIVLDRMFARATILATIAEDLPYRDNRVFEHGHRDGRTEVAISYRIGDYDKQRISHLRKRMQRVLDPCRYLLLKQAENNERLAHVCGTCRFGLDPRESVLDRNNKTHGLGNLYVLDASFFPSSGGTNPALTIAANALRVADHVIQVADVRP